MKSRSEQGRVHRLAFDVDWPPGHVACYLADGPEPILVDAATPDREAAFRDRLADLDFDPGDVEHVIVTHPHVDHIGQVPTVLAEGDPTVYAPAGVRERFARDPDDLAARVRRNCVAAGFPEDMRETAVEMAVDSLQRDSALLNPDRVDVWLDPGERATVGGLAVEAVHVPGHQADHLGYRTEIDGETALLAGDVGIEPFRPVVMHDGLDDGHREAFDAFDDALDRLAALDVDRVYPGHGPVHDDLAGVVERDRRSLADRLENVRDLVADGHATVPAVAMALAGDRDVKYLVPETMSALAHLERTGAVTSETVDGVRRYDA
ncbi:hydroxyacylglutathione hydrolase [Halobacteriales archaeon QS_9_70_65]|nr:MAG: hydroxyacylglutathione hydrolase [Halobacteriales archaeon QS_9_70_65]